MNSLNSLNKILLDKKRVIVRGDLDVPIEDEKILDSSRLDAMRETLDYILLRNATVILIGHMGRPDGKFDSNLKLNPVADYLKSLNYRVTKLDAVLSSEVFSACKTAKGGEIVLLENLRFYPEEEKNDETFAKDLSSLADLYVNECFATCHREHASIVGISKFLKAYSGFRLEREIEALTKVLKNPVKPMVAILGGAKIETKLPVISRFLAISDYVLLGGKIGLSYEGDNNNKILVPVDYEGEREDIGPATINMFVNIVRLAKTIIWNGPMGKIEHKSFMNGTKELAEAIAESDAYSLVGGGDTIEALDKLKLRSKMSFVSMGGGAMLEFISGKNLPGLLALEYEKENS